MALTLKQRSRGFTLIELIVTVAVMAVGLTLAISGYNNLITSNRLTSTTNELVESIKQAQMQAIKRNTQVQFCSNSTSNNTTSTMGAACGSSAGAVYWIDPAAPSVAAQIQTVPQVPASVAFGDGTNSTKTVAALLFSGNGLAIRLGDTSPYSGLVADVYSNSMKSNNHRCIYMTTGSALSSCSSSTACPSSEPTTCR